MKSGEIPGIVYARMNNPNLQIFEEWMAAWDHTEKSSVFASSMAAIATTLLDLVHPGEEIICTMPIYR